MWKILEESTYILSVYNFVISDENTRSESEGIDRDKKQEIAEKEFPLHIQADRHAEERKRIKNRIYSYKHIPFVIFSHQYVFI